VHAHIGAEMDKGAGIAMCCTFGDLTDVTWWRELDLSTRSVLTRNGRLRSETPDWITSPKGQAAYSEVAAKTVFSARAAVVEQLRASGDLAAEPVPTQRSVNFYENGDKPLEIVTSRQWYVRNGDRDPELKEALVARGREVSFYPDFMQTHYENWVNGLNGDWLVSRQRFFGVPIPIWFEIDADGEVDRDRLIIPDEGALPVDPVVQAPAGYDECQCNQPGGFAADPEIMDTWATSSLTPQIALNWRAGQGDPDSLWSQLFPMDLRAQAQDIIRTWLFTTVLRAHLSHAALPWHHAAISGWILDPDRKKMSKSKGNAETPGGIIAQYGADAVRYWASWARLGTDAAFDVGKMKIGRRLAIKVLNASKFVLSFREVASDPVMAVTEAADRSTLALLRDLVMQTTQAFEDYDHARALELTESFFWTFCDDYVELVKGRAYGEGTEAAVASARATLRIALDVLLRLFAPFLPYVTEEAFSWFHEASIHRSSWPRAVELDIPVGANPDTAVLTVLGVALSGLRRVKSDARTGAVTASRTSMAAASTWVISPVTRPAARRSASPDRNRLMSSTGAARVRAEISARMPRTAPPRSQLRPTPDVRSDHHATCCTTSSDVTALTVHTAVLVPGASTTSWNRQPAGCRSGATVPT